MKQKTARAPPQKSLTSARRQRRFMVGIATLYSPAQRASLLSTRRCLNGGELANSPKSRPPPVRISITSLRTLSLGRGLLPEFDSCPHRSLKLVKRLPACIADPRMLGAEDRTATPSRPAAARGIQPGGRAADRGCTTPNQPEAGQCDSGRCARKERKRSLRNKNLNRQHTEPVFSEPDDV